MAHLCVTARSTGAIRWLGHRRYVYEIRSSSILTDRRPLARNVHAVAN